MNIQDAIQILKGIEATLLDEATGAQAKLEGVQLAISQLEGKLVTENVELDAAKAKVDQLQIQVGDLVEAAKPK